MGFIRIIREICGYLIHDSEVATLQYVYHVSETPGINEFVPRRFWHVNYERSGPVSSESDIPADAEIITCFYASSEDYAPFYFPPQRCKRLFVWRQKNPEKFDLLGQVFCVESDKVLVLDEQDRPSVESHEFFVYSFDIKDFQRLPNGEFITHRTVVPLQKRRHKNALKHLWRAGYQVELVKDLSKTRQILLDMRLIVDSEGVL